jgi:transposase
MFSITSSRYFLYRESTDIRKGFDSLSGMVSVQLGQNPMSGDVFIFVNRQRNRIKLLRLEPGGFVYCFINGSKRGPLNFRCHQNRAIK